MGNNNSTGASPMPGAWESRDETSAERLPELRSADKSRIQANDIFIAVMGVTGAGKSTFISHCTNTKVPIGYGMTSCTQDVTVYPCNLSKSPRIWLVDTPGFNDTTRSDTQVLRDIALWLKMTYQNNIKLSGLIYLHQITDNRMQGSARKNLVMFHKLCGDDALSRVLLVTTRWDEVNKGIGEMREKELEQNEDYWGYMKRNGSQIKRHFNTRESARSVLECLFPVAATPTRVTLDIQSQMVDQGKSLHETTAGIEVGGDIARQRREHEREMAALRDEIRQARRENNQVIMKIHEEQQRTLQQQMERNNRDKRDLQTRFERESEQKKVEIDRLQRQVEAARRTAEWSAKTTSGEIARLRLGYQDAQEQQRQANMAMISSQQAQQAQYQQSQNLQQNVAKMLQGGAQIFSRALEQQSKKSEELEHQVKNLQQALKERDPVKSLPLLESGPAQPAPKSPDTLSSEKRRGPPPMRSKYHGYCLLCLDGEPHEIHEYHHDGTNSPPVLSDSE